MKKWLIGLTMSVALLAACGDEEAKSKKASENEEESGSIEVNKGLLNVEITLPAMFYEGETEEEIIASSEENDMKDVKVNEDGSVTFKVSKGKHKEMLEEMETGIKEGIEELVNGEDYTSFKEISFNKDFTKYEVTVDREAYDNSLDAFGMLGLYMTTIFYQAIDGKSSDDMEMIVDYIDAETKEVFETEDFTEVFDDTEE